MLSKPATLLLGIIYEKPLNAYEITKLLDYMNIKWWFNVADSTVYTTLKNLEKRGLIEGTIERIGNMPDKTIYSLTDKGGDELKETIRESIIQFSFDTNIFTIAAFVMDILETEEKEKLLEKRLNILQSYLTGISKQDNEVWKQEAPDFHVANLERMIDIVQAEISGTKRLLSVIEEEKIMKNKWLRFDIDKENIFGLVCGLIMVLVSIAMALFNSEISNIILRDILMILFLGFLRLSIIF